MKVSIISSPFGYIPPYGYGAVERRWFNIGRILAKDNDVSVIAKKNTNNIKYEIVEDIKIHYIKGYSRTGTIIKDLFLDFIFSWKALWELKKTDILVMNTFWSPILCFLFNSKYLISVYNVARYPKHQFRFYSHIDQLDCVSNAVFNELKRQVPKCKAIVIPNPISTETFFYHEEQKSSELILLYSGRVHPEKGLDLLVRAYVNLRLCYTNLRLKIVGPREIKDGGGGFKYIDQLNNFCGENIIQWIDPISDPLKLREQIVSCNIFIYPSIAEKGETFGVAPLEAMATGRATIVSDLECFKDFIQHGTNGIIFDHRSPKSITFLQNSIKNLIDDEDYRKKIARHGAYTATKYSNELIAKQYNKNF